MATRYNLPALPIDEWEETKNTLHLYLQIVGKVQLALMPRKNHWWNITLLVNAKGLVTHTMPANGFTFEIQFNFLEHQLEVVTSNGNNHSFPLHDGLSVADFYNKLFEILGQLDIHPRIIARPYDNTVKIPFSEITELHKYDGDYVQRFWKILVWVDEVMNDFSGRFYGKTCPVHMYWHHMDLTVTRFSGRKAAPMPAESKISDKDAYSHEVISFGFWAGDENVRGAAFYSYTYPSPAGLEQQPLQPASAKWQISNGSPMAMLMYDDLRQEEQPAAALLAFFESSYCAGATLAKWDMEDMHVPALSEM